MDNFQRIKELFEENGDEQKAAWSKAYMRNQFDFYGVTATKRKALCSDFLKLEKKKGAVDWEFLDRCYENEYREFQYLVMDYLASMQKFLTYDDAAHIKKYIQTKSWWDTVDGLDKIAGNIYFTDDRISALMLEWSADGDFWVCRAAIDHQRGRRDKTDAKLLEEIIVNNFGSEEFFINKAIGWSLREYSKTNPDWVRRFLTKYSGEMNKLSIREAGKYIKGSTD